VADIDVSFACNDHRNGTSLHRFEHVEFSEDAAECECALWGPWTSVRVHLQKRPGQKFATVTIGNRIYRIKGYRSQVETLYVCPVCGDTVPEWAPHDQTHTIPIGAVVPCPFCLEVWPEGRGKPPGSKIANFGERK
jgi:hypothetical protein